jgi:hypothetical protein
MVKTFLPRKEYGLKMPKQLKNLPLRHESVLIMPENPGLANPGDSIQ